MKVPNRHKLDLSIESSFKPFNIKNAENVPNDHHEDE
jgi:hypothetical protein